MKAKRATTREREKGPRPWGRCRLLQTLTHSRDFVESGGTLRSWRLGEDFFCLPMQASKQANRNREDAILGLLVRGKLCSPLPTLIRDSFVIGTSCDSDLHLHDGLSRSDPDGTQGRQDAKPLLYEAGVLLQSCPKKYRDLLDRRTHVRGGPVAYLRRIGDEKDLNAELVQPSPLQVPDREASGIKESPRSMVVQYVTTYAPTVKGDLS
jgi:hypothetical protein